MFSEQQLDIVQLCADRCMQKRSGPWAVALMVEEDHRELFGQQELNLVRFCAEECRRQSTRADAVAWMVNAYQYAATILRPHLLAGGKLEVEHILTLVAMIEPRVNGDGFRTSPVSFRYRTVVLNNQDTIPSQISSLLRVQDSVTPAQFYQEYEEIHPCSDGNGRAGSILFNLLGGTLDNPVVPPPFKKGRTSYESSFGPVEE